MTRTSPEPPSETAHLPATTTVGAVHLTVADLARSADFYQRAVGLGLLWRDDHRAALGAGSNELIVLYESPGARPARGVCGLFHLALLLPDRVELARWLVHAANDGVRLSGMSDHFLSEALYLDDPDGHGIEIYADRPRPLWEGQTATRIVVEPLDTGALVATLGSQMPTSYTGLPGTTRMGHVHLRVSEMSATRAFFGEVLGFELMGRLGSTASFYGAGGYHHHFGVNVWGSEGAQPAASGAATLVKATILLPDLPTRDRVMARAGAAGGPVEESADGVLLRDPSGLSLELLVQT